jgi:hypothetical protein
LHSHAAFFPNALIEPKHNPFSKARFSTFRLVHGLKNYRQTPHEVKPRVWPSGFPRKCAHAVAQTRILSASKAARKERRRLAGTSGFDPGRIGRKSRRERPLHPERRSGRQLSQPANTGAFALRAPLRLERAFCRLRQSLTFKARGASANSSALTRAVALQRNRLLRGAPV